MKIGIITFHMAFNYGAMLQAYALCKKLNDMKYNAEIIDYRLEYINNWHKKDRLKELIEASGLLIGIRRYIKRIIARYYTKDKQWLKFYNFMTKTLKLSPNTYLKPWQLSDLGYDAYICGSDQIWNTKLTNGFCDEYYLAFAEKKAKKIAYAASNGKGTLEENEKDRIINHLKSFTSIGIREKALSDYLNNECGIQAQNVLDPIFLLDQKEWDIISKKTKYRNYLLIYAFDEDKSIYEAAKNIAKEKDLIIIAIKYKYDDNMDKNIIQITDCGPEEFVGLIQGANFVCTTSFHGTAFSIMFNKDFYCFPHKEVGERTNSLLKLCGLSNRNVYDNIKGYYAVDYSKVNVKLQKEKEKSINFLKKSLK